MQGRTDGGDTAVKHTRRLRLTRDVSVLRLAVSKPALPAQQEVFEWVQNRERRQS